MDSITILSDHPLVLSIVPYTSRAISVLIRHIYVVELLQISFKFHVLLVFVSAIQM